MRRPTAGLAGGAFAEMRKDFPADYEAMKDKLADNTRPAPAMRTRPRRPWST